MTVPNQSGSQCEPTPESISAELERVLASVPFRNADRLNRFLRFVVERTVAANASQLKEYCIGTEVFGRPSSYDPRLDPVVRIEARRLRAKLQQYYEAEGRDAPFRIEVPKGGYSAVFQPRETSTISVPAAPEREIPLYAGTASQSSARRLRWLVAGVGVICLALVALFLSRRDSGSANSVSNVRSVAVLPFQNLSSNPEDEYFSDGLTDELTGALGRGSGLRVAARASTFRFKGKTDNLRSVGEQLNVGSIVVGTVRKDGDSLRITAELIRTSDSERLWTETYSRKTADLVAVEDDISGSIASALTKALLNPASRNGASRLVDPEAHDLYLRGRYWWNRRTLADMRKALQFFNQALEHDPVYAEGYLGLADTYSVMGANEQAPPQEVFPKATAAVEKALQLDDSLSEAHVALADITFFYDQDFARAEQEFQKAIALNPSSAPAHQWYGLLLLYTRRFDEAVTEFKKAQVLDPLSLLIPADLGRVYFYAGNYEAARQITEQLLTYDPGFALAHDSLGQIYAWTGKYKKAQDELQKYYALSGHDPDALVLEAETYALAGQREQALALLRQLQDPKSGYSSAYSFAAIYACLGDEPQVYKWLERANQERGPGTIMLAVDPAFRNFRSDARYQKFLNKFGKTSGHQG